MAVELIDPSVDIDCRTGGDIAGWPHVVQCINDIFTTDFGERIMREWYGSMVPRLLGELLNAETVTAFFVAVGSAIEQWEPRFRVVQIVPESVGRDGHFHVAIEGYYRPRALFGDFTVEGARRITINGLANTFEVV